MHHQPLDNFTAWKSYLIRKVTMMPISWTIITQAWSSVNNHATFSVSLIYLYFHYLFTPKPVLYIIFPSFSLKATGYRSFPIIFINFLDDQSHRPWERTNRSPSCKGSVCNEYATWESLGCVLIISVIQHAGFNSYLLTFLRNQKRSLDGHFFFSFVYHIYVYILQFLFDDLLSMYFFYFKGICVFQNNNEWWKHDLLTGNEVSGNQVYPVWTWVWVMVANARDMLASLSELSLWPRLL